jgi:hypothetical protein
MATRQPTVEEWKAQYGLDIYDDAELSEMMLQYLEGNNGGNLFRLLEDVKDEAAHDPSLQADIDKVCSHPRLKALLRN